LSDYKVALDIYSGPLDLLLFLIRREEIDIYDIPIARITAQYLEYVDLLKTMDPDGVGEFLVLAATLMEIKSRTLLPRVPDEEIEEEGIDPRLTLVRQLLEYKKFKDAARALEESAEERALRRERRPVLPAADGEEIELENLEIWDLFDAFQRLLKQIGKAEPVHKVGIDDTPIALHAADIVDSLERAGGQQPFEEIFAGRRKPEMIGLFLALLELIRQRRVGAVQERPCSTIMLALREPPVEDEEDYTDGDGWEKEAEQSDGATQRRSDEGEEASGDATERRSDQGAAQPSDEPRAQSERLHNGDTSHEGQASDEGEESTADG